VTRSVGEFLIAVPVYQCHVPGQEVPWEKAAVEIVAASASCVAAITDACNEVVDAGLLPSLMKLLSTTFDIKKEVCSRV